MVSKSFVLYDKYWKNLLEKSFNRSSRDGHDFDFENKILNLKIKIAIFDFNSFLFKNLLVLQKSISSRMILILPR